MVQGDLLASRFRQGKIALPVSVIETLHAVKNKPFSSQDALDKWLDEQDFDSSVRKKVSESVPPTKRIADDTVIALDLTDGSKMEDLYDWLSFWSLIFFDPLCIQRKTDFSQDDQFRS